MAVTWILASQAGYSRDMLWNGSSSSDWFDGSRWLWYNGTTWETGVPSAADSVYIIGRTASLETSAQHDGLFLGWATPLGAFSYGTGYLDVRNGATLTTNYAYLGGNYGGSATIAGAGSLWNNNGYLGVGSWVNSSLSVTSGGRVNADSLDFGYSQGIQGDGTISGGMLNVNTRLNVGYSGSGNVTVSNQGAMISGWAYLGANAGASGTVTVSGVGSYWNTGGIATGYGGIGQLNIYDGGVVYNNFLPDITASIGESAGSSGQVRIAGAGSQYLVSGQLNIGSSGTGSLVLTDDGYVGVAGAGGIQLARNAGSIGILQVGEGGSAGLWSAPVINGGAGSARIVFNHNDILLAPTRLTGSLSVTQSGPGATILSNASNTYSGGTIVTSGVLGATSNAALGSGALVLDGGTFRYEGDFDDLRNITLTRAGSKIDTNGYSVGYFSTISTNYEWTKTGAGNFIIMSPYSGSQTITVDGGGLVGLVNNAFGSGTINVYSGAAIAAGGATLNNRNLVVRARDGQTAALTVDDATWNLNYGVTVDARSTMLVENSATLDTGISNIGVGGQVILSGPGTSWNIRANQGPGLPGRGPGWSVNGELAIRGGAYLSTIEDYIYGAAASVEVSGAGSRWDTNALMIRAGASVTVADAGTLYMRDIDGYAALSGSLKVTGPGAIFDTPYLMLDSEEGTPHITVSDGGRIRLRGDAGSGQELNLSAGATVQIGEGGAAGTLETLAIRGSGPGTAVIFNHDESNLVFDTPLSGSLQVYQIGSGTTVISSINSYYGGTVVSDGTLVAGINGALGSGGILLEGGILRIEGGVSLNNAITLAGGTLIRSLSDGAQLSALGTIHSSVADSPHATSARIEGQMSAEANVETTFTAVSGATNDNIRISDVFTLDGIPVLDAETGETDMFVLALTTSTAVDATSFLGWLDTRIESATYNQWINAVLGNIGGEAYFAGDRAYDAATDFHLGTYGVDSANGRVWAVLNHNSEFSAVPEPSTWALIVWGAFFASWHYRRRRRPECFHGRLG